VIALLRTEFVKATYRVRTLVIFLLLVGLPTLIVVAIKTNHRHDRGEGGDGLFFLSQQSGLLVPVAVLAVMSGFLLVVIAGLLAGDAVAGDSASGNLRYVLMRPVRRTRLLLAKALVAGFLIWVTVILLAIAGLVAGVIVFGSHPLVVPAFRNFAGTGGFGVGAGFTLSTSTLLARLAVVTAYVAFGYTALLAIGMFFSTLTDTATGAIGGTVGLYIVSEILDAIPQIGRIRYAFPTHYLDKWQPVFLENRYPHDMLVGVFVQLAYFVVFATAAVVWFGRKDIRS
jgi:ABC-2 type transport system permease protein